MTVRGLILASLCSLAPTAGASEGERLASDQGCLNCHYNLSHSSPSLKRLADRLGRDGSSAEALQHALREMRSHSTVHGHLMVTDESALAILQWMAQGAK